MSGATSRHRARRRGAGFTLMELLAVVILIGAFMLISLNLFRQTMQIIQTQGAGGAASQTDAALERLRKDVWNSSLIDSWSSRMIVMTTHDHILRWGFEPANGVIERVERRDEAASETRLWRIPGDVTFEVDGPIVRVMQDGKCIARMHSQRQLMEKQP